MTSKTALGIELDDRWNAREDRNRVNGIVRQIQGVSNDLLGKIKVKGLPLREWVYQHGGLAGVARQSDPEVKRAYFQFRKELEAFVKGLPTTDVNQFFQTYGSNPLDWSFINMTSQKRASALFQKRADALAGVRDGDQVVELADLRDHFETTLSKDKREAVVDHKGDPATENYPKEQPTREEKRDQAPEFKEPDKAGPCKTAGIIDTLYQGKPVRPHPELREVLEACQSGGASQPWMDDYLEWLSDTGIYDETAGGGTLTPDGVELLEALQKAEGISPEQSTKTSGDEMSPTGGVCEACGAPAQEGMCPDCMEAVNWSDPGASPTEPAMATEAAMEVTADEEGNLEAELISDPSMDYLIDTYGADDQVLYKAIIDHFAPLHPGKDLSQVAFKIVESLGATEPMEDTGPVSADPATNTAPERVQNAGGALADA